MLNFLKKKYDEKNGLICFDINDLKTKSVTEFYKSTPFPNYKEADNIQSIIVKGNKNLFTFPICKLLS